MRKSLFRIFSFMLVANMAMAAGPAVFEDMNLSDALAKGKSEDKAVLVKFDATWCGYCRAMDARTFSNNDVESSLSDYISIKVDVDTEEGKALARQYGVRGTPYIAVFNSSGKLIHSQPGYQGPEDFMRTMAAVDKKK